MAVARSSLSDSSFGVPNLRWWTVFWDEDCGTTGVGVSWCSARLEVVDIFGTASEASADAATMFDSQQIVSGQIVTQFHPNFLLLPHPVHRFCFRQYVQLSRNTDEFFPFYRNNITTSFINKHSPELNRQLFKILLINIQLTPKIYLVKPADRRNPITCFNSDFTQIPSPSQSLREQPHIMKAAVQSQKSSSYTSTFTTAYNK